MLLYLLYKLNIPSCLLCSRWDTNSHIQKSMTRSWGPACYMRTSGDRSLTCQTHSSRSVQQGNISYVMPIHQEQLHISETLSYVRLRHPDQYISETLSYVRLCHPDQYISETLSYVRLRHPDQYISETLSYVRLRHPDQYISETLSYVRPRQVPGNHTNPANITFSSISHTCTAGPCSITEFQEETLDCWPLP